MSLAEYARHDALGLAALVANKDVSPRELAALAMRAIDAVNPALNAVIATLPDETCMLVMDQKKLRPATVGGRPGAWAIASEMCGVDALVPDRDPALDFQPMRQHTVLIPPERKELTVWSQFDPCTLPQAA